jgi:replicative DNA helicase
MEMTADPALEAALISEALRRYDRFVARGLAEQDFTSARHQAIFAACERLWEAGTPVTVGSVALELQRAGLGLLCEGERGLAALAVPTHVVPDHEQLKQLTRLRKVIEVATMAATRAREGNLAAALSALAEADQLGSPTQTTQSATGITEHVLGSLVDKARGDGARVFLGMRELDNALGRMPVGGLLVIGADSNVGKSSYALAMMIAMAEAGVASGMVSMEDPFDVTGARLLSSFTRRVSSREIQHGRFGDLGERSAFEEMGQAVEILKRHDKLMFFDDCVGGTELDVCAAMSRQKALGARLVVVDYVQEIEASRRQQDRRNEVRWIAKRLKTHARRIGVALVLVSQIARPKPGEEFKQPSKHSLKESGDLVNSADAIVLLWRECSSDSAPVHAVLAKSKWGGVGMRWTLARNPGNGAMVET